MAALRVLYLGTVQEAAEAVRRHFKDVEEIQCSTRAELEKLLLCGQVGGAGQVHLVLAGPDFDSSVPQAELAQSLRMSMQTTPIYYVTNRADGFDRQSLTKNGFYEAFLLPLDQEVLGKVLAKVASDAEHSVYSAVRLVDIEAGSKLNFQIALYLPANKKYLTYTAEGDVMEAERLERLRRYKQTSVYVPIDQVANFHSYSAQRLKELEDEPGQQRWSESERQDRLRESVRELATGLISESYSRQLSQGRKVIEHTKSIVKQYILLSQPGEWYSRILNEVGQKGDGYSHLSSVATYAALFSVVLKRGRPDEMAVAGLLHDLGLTMLPPALQNKRVEDMSKEEKAVFYRHPQLTIEIVRARKLIVPESVIKAIIQHHERWDGSGYPDALQFKRISPEGQVLALADRFDYLTRAVDSAPMSPDQAIRQLERENVADPEMTRELRLTFERQQKSAS